MATIKRERKPKNKPEETTPAKEAETKESPIIQAAEKVTPEVQTPKPVEPVIRVLPARAIPKLQPQAQNSPAPGNVLVCDRKTGKCTSMSAAYANQFVNRNKNLYIKK